MIQRVLWLYSFIFRELVANINSLRCSRLRILFIISRSLSMNLDKSYSEVLRCIMVRAFSLETQAFISDFYYAVASHAGGVD